MTVYCIAQAQSVDQDALAKYREHAPNALKKHGGALVSSSQNILALEGANDVAQMMVILSFPTEEAAKAWRFDDDLAPVHDLRMKAANWTIQLLA